MLGDFIIPNLPPLPEQPPPNLRILDLLFNFISHGNWFKEIYAFEMNIL